MLEGWRLQVQFVSLHSESKTRAGDGNAWVGVSGVIKVEWGWVGGVGWVGLGGWGWVGGAIASNSGFEVRNCAS